MERESKKQAAGFRTYMLVCLGASLVMMTNQFISEAYGMGDPSRLGAQVVSGIGFLGAGTIIVTRKSQVRGLTTAAGLWSAACLGLAIGIGFYEGAIIGGVAIFLIMTVFQRIDHMLMNHTKIFHLYTNFSSVDALNHFVEYCKERNIRVIDMQISKMLEAQNGIVVMLVLRNVKRGSHVELIQDFSGLSGLKYLEEI